MPKNNHKPALLERGPVPALVLILVCTVCVALLALPASVTAAARGLQAQRLADANKLTLFPQADHFPEEALEAAGPGIPGGQPLDLTQAHPSVIMVAVAQRSGQAEGLIITVSSKGYGGQVPVMVGFDLSGQILGIVVDAGAETAGLGQKVADPPFTGQFKGRESLDQLEDIDAVAGATISSDSVVISVAEAGRVFQALTSKGGSQDG